MIGRTIDTLTVGDVAELTRSITAVTIRQFVAASGDENPIHSDPAFAATTRFGRVIAPGMLTGGMLSAVIGTRLPGPGTIYLSQNFRFLRPVYLGDTITARVEVTEVVRDRGRVRLGTLCLNQGGERVVEGDAWVMPSPLPIEYSPPESQQDAASALCWAPTTLAVQMTALCVSTAFTLAAQALEGFGGALRIPTRPAPSPRDAKHR